MNKEFNARQERMFDVMVQLQVRRGLSPAQLKELEIEAGQLGFESEGSEIIKVAQKVRAYLRKEEPDKAW